MTDQTLQSFPSRENPEPGWSDDRRPAGQRKSRFPAGSRDRAAALRERVWSDPVAAYERTLGTQLTKRGKELYALCPLHPDRRPSLRLNSAKATWYCDVCARGGDIFDLYPATRGLSIRTDFARVVDELAASLGVADDRVPRTRGARPPTSREHLALRIAQEPAPASLPDCCLARESRCEHWQSFDRRYLVEVLRGNLAVAIRELIEKATKGRRYDLESRPLNLPLGADELREGIKFALPFGAIVPSGVPYFIVDHYLEEAISQHLRRR
jgi:hypothetical protein